jgi:GrpB-like predicted nucleotidyltransferase (UPF0157 family)
VLPEEILMHSVAVPTDPKPSDAGVTGASTPPIGRYLPVPVQVHEADPDAPEVAPMRGFRDALRANPVLRRRYAALKRAIAAGGAVDPVTFTKAKHDWIAATLAHLGLAGHPPRRLYQDDPDLDRPHRLAS